MPLMYTAPMQKKVARIREVIAAMREGKMIAGDLRKKLGMGRRDIPKCMQDLIDKKIIERTKLRQKYVTSYVYELVASDESIETYLESLKVRVPGEYAMGTPPTKCDPYSLPRGFFGQRQVNA